MQPAATAVARERETIFATNSREIVRHLILALIMFAYNIIVVILLNICIINVEFEERIFHSTLRIAFCFY